MNEIFYILFWLFINLNRHDNREVEWKLKLNKIFDLSTLNFQIILLNKTTF